MVGSSEGAEYIIAAVFLVAVLGCLAFFVGPDFLEHWRKSQNHDDEDDDVDPH